MATSSPQLTLPGSETIDAQATIQVSGISYTDSFAFDNPGSMYLHVWDSTGLLSAQNSAGAMVPGSGTDAITLSAPYADIAAVLDSLTYTAAATTGSDTISFDLWDQAGAETTGSIPVTVVAGSGATATTDTWTGAVSADWNNGANWSSGAAPAAGDQVAIPGGTPNTPALDGAVLSGETISLTSGGGQGGSAAFTNVTLGAGTILQDVASATLPQPAMTLGGTFTVASGATLAAGSASLFIQQSASATTPAEVVNHGTIAGDGGHLNIDTGGSVVNDGLITASNSGGVGFDFGEFTNSLPAETIVNGGTIQAAGGSLYINGTVQGGTLQFSGAGEMVLEQPNALADGATITGFGAGDTIDLYLINASSLSFANGVLTVMNGATPVESLPMSGNYSTGNFQLVFQPGQEFSNVITYAAAVDPPASGPQITAPASETVSAGGTLAVAGVSVADSFAAANPGSMALNVTDTSGTLRMTDASGAALPGSGTGSIHYTGTFSQVNAALATLTYTAGGSAGSDSIVVDVWDQAGKEATGSVGVTVGTGASPSPTGGGSPASGGTVINGTPGDDTIVSNLNGVTINAGAGNDSVFAGGTGDTITATSGNNTIQAFAGGNTITTGAGNDTIRIAGSGSTVDAGGGANIIEDSGSGNTLVLPTAGQGTDDVYGYVLTNNDRFDLRHALTAAGWQGTGSTLADYLSVGTAGNGADTTVSVVPGGRGAGSVVATLHGNGGISLASFLNHALAG